MEVPIEKTRFVTKKLQIDCIQGGSAEVIYRFVGGVDFNTIEHTAASCGCINPQVYVDHVKVVYNDDGKMEPDQVVKFEEKTAWVVYENDPGEEKTPLFVKNDKNVDVINYNGRPWEALHIMVRVKRKV